MTVTVWMIGLYDCEQCLTSTAAGAGLWDLCLFVADAGWECILLGHCIMNEVAPRFHAWDVFAWQITLGHVIVISECKSCVQSHVVFPETEVQMHTFPFCGCEFGESKTPGSDLFRFISFATWG